MTKNADTDKYKYQSHGIGLIYLEFLVIQMEEIVKVLLFWGLT